MTLSAAYTEYKASPQDKQPLRSEIQNETEAFFANGGRIQQVATGPVKYVPIKFTIKPR